MDAATAREPLQWGLAIAFENLSWRLDQAMGQVPGSVHQTPCLKCLLSGAIENQKLVKGRFHAEGAQALQQRMSEAPERSHIGLLPKFGQCQFNCRQEPPRHFLSRLIYVPGKLAGNIRLEKLGFLNRQTHPRFSRTIRSQVSRISVAEYGVKGPLAALSNSASSSGLSSSSSPWSNSGFQRNLLVPVSHHDQLAATRLGNELSKLVLGFLHCNRFHAETLP